MKLAMLALLWRALMWLYSAGECTKVVCTLEYYVNAGVCLYRSGLTFLLACMLCRSDDSDSNLGESNNICNFIYSDSEASSSYELAI